MIFENTIDNLLTFNTLTTPGKSRKLDVFALLCKDKNVSITFVFPNFAKIFPLKKLFLAFLLFVFFSDFSSAQLSLSYIITGLKDNNVFLSAVKGSRYIKVDSCNSINGLINFNDINRFPVGVYRISFEDSLFTDVILNNENIIVTNSIKNLKDSTAIISSEENKIYYEYWGMANKINDSINMITQIGNAVYEANGNKLTPDLDSMAMQIYNLSEKLNKFTWGLVSKSPGLYVSKLLKAYITPEWQAYKKSPGAKYYPNKYNFLKDRFFDNIDFSDSTLLNSEVFYVLCNDYLSKFADPPSDSAYISAIDFILNKAQPYQPVYDYILDLFVNTFDNTEWEETFIHLVDDYLLKNTCTPDEHDKNMSERAASLKKLKPGNKAPDILSTDAGGNPVTLYSTKSKITLLMFWSSECPHCEEVMSQMLHIYSVYHPLGLEIFAVSADTDRSSWITAINKHGLKWVNVSDLLEFKSPSIAAYNAYSTPTFFLLDTEKNIISHPYSPRQMSEGLQKVFGK